MFPTLVNIQIGCMFLFTPDWGGKIWTHLDEHIVQVGVVKKDAIRFFAPKNWVEDDPN